jgi:general secretion pathway protein A
MGRMMYYEHFGLREAPFKFLPSNTLFLSVTHLEGLAALERAFREPSGLTLLVGEVGTGKTMLIHALATRLKPDRIRIAQISNPKMSFEEMLGVIVQQLGIHPPGSDKLASLQALKTFVADTASTNTVILVFDEAQGLSDETLEELRLLSNSRAPRHALQIILVGQPELVRRLTEPKLQALNQRIGARALLRPLRGAEIYDYVNYLLRAQGARHKVFSRGALEQVACLSGGLPRKINNLCHNSLLLAYADTSMVVEPRHVQAASVEIENLLEGSRDQDYRPIEVRRGAMHWMLGRGKPVMAGGLSALAVVIGALVLEFGTGTGSWFARFASVHTDRAQSVGGFAETFFANPDQGHEERVSEAWTAPSLRSDQGTNHVQGLPALAPVADAPAVAPKLRPEPTSGTLFAQPASFLPGTPTALASTNSALAKPCITLPASDDRLTHVQERRLRYEIKRAKRLFNAGRYRKAIYYLQQALLFNPGNGEMRALLQHGQAAQSKPEKSASAHDSRVSPLNEDEKITNARAETSSRSKSLVAAVVRDEISEGDASMRTGQYDIALRKYKTAAVLGPGNKGVTDRIRRAQRAKAMAMVRDEISEGDTSMRAGQYDIALRKYRTAVVLGPGKQDVTDRIRRAQRAKAMAVVRDEISEGDASMRAGQYSIALRKFRIAVELDPGNEDVTDRLRRAQRAKAVESTSR